MIYLIRVTVISLLIVCSTTVRAQVTPGAELVTIDGSAGMQPVFLNTKVATTITFSGTISLVTGFGLVQDLRETQTFQPSSNISIIHYQQVAGDTMVLRMLRPGTPCFMTVKTDQGFFMLQAEPSIEANLAVIVTNGDSTKRTVEMSDKAVAEKRIDYEPMALVGILSRAQQRAFLQTVNPELYEGWEERNGIGLKSTSRGAEINIYEIQRWAEKDALVLRAMVENTSDNPFSYDPSAAEVRVGNRVYPVQLADGPSDIAPGKRVALDVVMVGNSLGGKEHLSISNDFRLELPAGRRSAGASSALFPTEAPVFGPKNPVIDQP